MSVSTSSHNSGISSEEPHFNDGSRVDVIINGKCTSIPADCMYCKWCTRNGVVRCLYHWEYTKLNYTCDSFSCDDIVEEPKEEQICLTL